MKTALYHRTDGQAPKELQIIQENADGTFDLGIDGHVIVSECPASLEGKAGHCTVPREPAPANDPGSGKDADKTGDESKADEKTDPKGGKKSGKDTDKP